MAEVHLPEAVPASVVPSPVSAFGDMAVMITACKRPYYLKDTLASWKAARGVEHLRDFVVALGDSARGSEQLGVIGSSGVGARIVPDRLPGQAMHRPIAEAIDGLFQTAGREFVIASEEDVVVSSDVLEYFAWAKAEFADDPRVLCVCAHSVGGQGWDKHVAAQDADADQAQARLLPYYNAWCWGTWKNRWPVLWETWDFDCNSGDSAGPSGYDWNIAVRVIPEGNFLCVVPDASRSQNIGEDEGWASNPWSWTFSQAQSFRRDRDPVEYKLMP